MKRLKRVYFYVNNEELLKVEKERRKFEKTRAVYLRDLVLKNRILISKTDTQALSLLQRISVNINQIARRVNTELKNGELCTILSSELSDIKKELSNIHFAIMGGNMTDESKDNKRE